jgi:hypothetical protein
MTQCPWKIHFGVGQEMTVQCQREEHLPEPGAYASYDPRLEHEGLFNGITKINWYEGDRREYTGDWPGNCDKLPGMPMAGGCTLHLGHHGRCAP